MQAMVTRNLEDAIGHHCPIYLVVGSRGTPVQCSREDSSVTISITADDAVPLSALGLSSKVCSRCTGRESDQTPVRAPLRSSRSEPMVLPYRDLLGARLDVSKRAVVLQYCPTRRGPGTARSQKDVVLYISSNGDMTNVLEGAKLWAASVTDMCLETPQRLRGQQQSPGDNGIVAAQRNLVVYVNPASGKGRAPQVWQEVEALWKTVPGLHYEMKLTTSAGAACEDVKQLNLDCIDGIVIVSGDGLVHEVLNGLATRPDKERAFTVPIGHIMGGSGNALAHNILLAAGEHNGVFEAAFLIAKGKQTPLDLMSVQVPGRDRMTSFLSLSAATISDIDIESEKLRCMGEARFTMWGLLRVLKPLRLEYKLEYWPADAVGPIVKEPHVSEELPAGPWQTIEDSFAILWGMNMEWGSSTLCPCPGASMNDGMWHILLLRGHQVTRKSVFKALIGLERGTPWPADSETEMIKCKAFRLTPGRSTNGHLAIDGERLPADTGCVQAWPLDYKGTVFGGAP